MDDKRPDLPQQFLRWIKIPDDPDACWEWQGARQRGYGVCTKYLYGTSRPHVYVYLMLVDEIEEGMHIDHLCRNRACCNPKHLEQVTLHENVVVRGTGITAKNAQKTHCPRGREYDRVNSQGRRTCSVCDRNAVRRARQQWDRMEEH